MTSQYFPDPGWLAGATGQQPTTLDVWDGVPSLFLAPTFDGGAIMWWQFDQGDEGSQYILLVHLTQQEAQTVFEHRDGGVLESVRTTLNDDSAYIVRRNPSAGYERVIARQIPQFLSEDRFTDWLDQAANELALEPLPPRDVMPRPTIAGRPLSMPKSPIERLAATASAL